MQMPVAGLSAQSGAPIVFVSPAGVPAATAAALGRLHHPTVYLPAACAASARTKSALARLGRVVAFAGGEEGKSGEGGAPSGSHAGAPARGQDAVENAVEIARFSDGSFGWGIHEPGHGLVFANSSLPFDAPAAAPLSAHGDYAPLLLVGDGSSVPSALGRYLTNIEPGIYTISDLIASETEDTSILWICERDVKPVDLGIAMKRPFTLSNEKDPKVKCEVIERPLPVCEK